MKQTKNFYKKYKMNKGTENRMYYFLSENIDDEDFEFYICAMPQVFIDHGIEFPIDITYCPFNKKSLKDEANYLQTHSNEIDRIYIFNNSPLMVDFYRLLIKLPSLKSCRIKFINMNPKLFKHTENNEDINGYIK